LLLARIILMNQTKGLSCMLKKWQHDLYELVKKRQQTIKVCIFDNSFWVVVKRPTTSLVFKYSQIYANLLDKYPDLRCDFLVLGEKQFEYAHIPSDAIMLELLEQAFK
jgi:hypothetical protein